MLPVSWPTQANDEQRGGEATIQTENPVQVPVLASGRHTKVFSSEALNVFTCISDILEPDYWLQ